VVKVGYHKIPSTGYFFVKLIENFSLPSNDIRRELSVPDIPFIIGGLGDYLGKVAFGAGCGEYQLINDELQKYARANENCYYVTANVLSTANTHHIRLIFR
jgi:hypothetical protein